MFQPEEFLIPQMENSLRRLFGARWGIILVSAPDEIALDPVLDFLANYSLRLSFYSHFSAEKCDFNQLQKESLKLRTLEDILKEAADSLPHLDSSEHELVDSPGIQRHIPRNPELIFTPVFDSHNAAQALQAALSGRLVVSGMHAEGSFTALQNYRGFLQSDHLVGATLMGIIGLNLVRKICPECKTQVEYELSDEDVFFIGAPHNTLKGYQGLGCDACQGTGYSGKMLISETFELSETLRKGILNGMKPRQLKMQAKSEGMTTLLDAAWELAEAGQTTLEEVIRIVELTDPGGTEGIGN